MHQPTRQRHALGIACCLLLLACPSGGQEPPAGAPERAVAEPEETYSLDLARRSLVQPLPAELAAEAQKLVQIEITEVVNPRRIRLTFELRYRPEEGDGVLLGTFGLFPPDNPGRFVVGTRGELRAGGSIELSMIVLDEVGEEDEVRVELERLTLREE